MTNEYRLSILAKIKSSIASEGYHLCFVDGGPLPRFAYTIGLYPQHSFELVFGGGTIYNLADVKQIFTEIVGALCWNYWRFPSQQIAVAPLPKLKLDEAAVLERFHGVDERIGRENYFDIVRFFHRYLSTASTK